MSPTRSTDADAVDQAFFDAVAAAGYAPSIHNTQPWRWRLGDHTLDLRLEPSRVLEVTDPDNRLATMSCGAALHHCLVSLAAQGWCATVTRMPQQDDPDHLATIRVDGRSPADVAAVLHLQAIPLRRTDRRPLAGAPVGAEDLRAITVAVEAEDTWLHTLNSDQVIELAGATDHAQRAEAGDPAWQAELAHWTGGTRPDGTGVPDSAIPGRPTLTTVPSRDFGHTGELTVTAAHDKSAVYVLLYGPADEPVDWLRAGEALSIGWIVATEHGVSVLPHSAPIEVISTRQAMRAVLASTGYPYLVLRLGTIDPVDRGPAHAPRLPTDQLIERS